MNARTAWLILCALALALSPALSGCSGQSSDDDDDNDDNDDAGDDDSADDDSADDDSGDDDVTTEGCDEICAKVEECGMGSADSCVDQCEGLASDAKECLGTATSESADCEMFTHYFDVCTHLDEMGTEQGDRVANFTVTDKDGNTVNLYDYMGYVIVLNSGAGWCPPCREEAPLLEQNIYQEYKDQGLTIIQLMFEDGSGGDPDEAFLKFWANLYDLTFPVCGDPNSAAYGPYFITDGSTISIPQSMVVDRDMKIVTKMVGYWENLMKSKIEKAL
jgi:peroxiredoxin